jgi:RHS repeat-associated protein
LQVWIGEDYEERDGKVLFHISAAGRRVCTFEPAAGGVTGYNPTNQQFYYYHPDYLGSSSVMTDRTGTNAVQHYEYSAFGQSRFTGNTNAFKLTKRYTGQALDEDTGLYFYNFRYYDPNLGRFTQPDDIIPDLANPQSYNRYSYCVNNPLRFTDPNGHAPSDWANAMQPGIDSYYGGYVSNPSHTSTLGLFAAYMGQSVAGGYNDMLRFGTGMEQGGVDGICADLGRGSGIVLTVAGPAKAFGTKSTPKAAPAPEVAPKTTSAPQTTATTPQATTSPANGAIPEVQGPPTATTRVSNRPGNQQSVQLDYPDGRQVDINLNRVKEKAPATDPRAAGRPQKVKFDNAQPGSKGLKRDPTPQELEIFKNRSPSKQ